MATTPAEYQARILSLVKGKDPVAVQRETPQQLVRLIAGAPAEKLRERPAPGKWSVAELLAHLAEAEIVSTWRYRQMLEHSGCPLQAYDQELWNKVGDYGSRRPDESLQLFRLLREANLRMFAQLTAEEWQRHGLHVERGKMSVQDLTAQIAGHDLNHVEQIQNILGRTAS
jgi:DinB superfamily